MAINDYTLNWSDTAKTPITIGYQGVDNSTSLTLAGKGSVGWGRNVQSNFLYLVENFASPVAPVNPVEGQIWYKSDSDHVLMHSSDISDIGYGPGWKLIYQKVIDDIIPTLETIIDHDADNLILETAIGLRETITTHDADIADLLLNINTRETTTAHDASIAALLANINTRELISSHNADKNNLQNQISNLQYTINNSGRSFANPGWARMTNGTIIQWGTINNYYWNQWYGWGGWGGHPYLNQYNVINLPLAFPNACLFSLGVSSFFSTFVKPLNQSQLQVFMHYIYYDYGTSYNGHWFNYWSYSYNPQLSYIAIGY